MRLKKELKVRRRGEEKEEEEDRLQEEIWNIVGVYINEDIDKNNESKEG